jgi:hypothetical protein
MSKLSVFFHGSDTHFGVFFPKDCLLAILPNMADAEHAVQHLRMSGYEEEDMVSASGPDLLRFAEGHAAENGLFGMLMTKLSRGLGTEALYMDQDLVEAQKGAALVAVHCPTETSKVHTWNLLAGFNPLAARYYGLLGIEHLAGDLED